MNSIKRVYVAGAFSSPSNAMITLNVSRAKKAARAVCEAGCYPVTPHITGDICRDLHDWEWWMATTSRDLSTCDAAVIIPPWDRAPWTDDQKILRSWFFDESSSKGTKQEVWQCDREGRPLFFMLTDSVLPREFMDWRDL